MLEERSSVDAALLLRRIKGIGPWIAAVILLRGLGRLDVFPGNDSSVAANLQLVAGERLDAGSVLEGLGPQRGMLYFYLLLARLEARGEFGPGIRAGDISSLSTFRRAARLRDAIRRCRETRSPQYARSHRASVLIDGQKCDRQ